MFETPPNLKKEIRKISFSLCFIFAHNGLSSKQLSKKIFIFADFFVTPTHYQCFVRVSNACV